ncbi:Lrp/AsnC family transcriptional regulator [Actinoplanes sp. NPDC051851]|uniref:Lrp/AsnC family transcriptional regulator n=1 Tax=Actinoplanes sp. NPDC051851 TaxID=3154753 RepID=UPI00341BF87F
MSEIELDPLDRALIDSLAIRPRATWSALAAVLGSDAGTLARRWRRLTGEGLARIAAEPGPARARSVAVIEIECDHPEVRGVVGRLAAEPVVVSVDITSGGRDLVVVAATVEHDDIVVLLTGRLTGVPGVRSVRAAFADSRIRADVVSFGALTGAQRAALRAIPEPATVAAPVDPGVERALGAVLARDARASWKELSDEAGLSPHRARSALAALLAGSRLQLRMRLSPRISHTGVLVWFFGKADPLRAGAVLDEIARAESVRFAAAVHGRYDLVACLRLRTMDDVRDFLERCVRQLPGVRFVDRSVVLRSDPFMHFY